VAYQTLAPGDQNGKRAYDIGLKLSRNSGDDELVIQYT